jgi:hypothetical protein
MDPDTDQEAQKHVDPDPQHCLKIYNTVAHESITYIDDNAFFNAVVSLPRIKDSAVLSAVFSIFQMSTNGYISKRKVEFFACFAWKKNSQKLKRN